MNYRHAYHAGNFADVLKHTVLLALLEALKVKPAPFSFVETHAGSGSYALDGHEAGKTNEYRDGISRLIFPDTHDDSGKPLPPLLRRWLDAILALPGNENGLKLYPGSPLQSAGVLRECDSAQLCELHPAEAAQLRDLLKSDPRMHAHQRDGYEAMKGLLPPPEKRGLVLIDPPYEAQEAEYAMIEQALKHALERWPTGMYAVWYPIKQRSAVQPFLRWLTRCGARRVLQAELLLRSDDSAAQLNGAGMVVLNAPWKLDETLREPMQALARLLSKEQPAQYKLDWLLSEDAAHTPPANPFQDRTASRAPFQSARTPGSSRRR